MNHAPSLVEQLLGQLQGAPMQDMAQQLGTSSTQLQSALGAALPLLLGALGQGAVQSQGGSDGFRAVQHDPSAAMPQGLGGLGSVLGAVLGGGSTAPGKAWSDGAAILGHVLGGQRQQIENRLGQATGLGDKAGQLLTMLAPIVMAFLAQRVQEGQLDAASLGRELDQARTQARQQGGVVGDVLGNLLDQNGDGKLDMGDLFQLGSSWFKGRR